MNTHSPVLVTGGAGFIGSHTCKALKKAGYTPVVFDSLIKGRRDAVAYGDFIEGDLLNPLAILRALEQVKPVAVVHFAGLIEVGESVKEPLMYYTGNTVATLNLLEAMRQAGVSSIIFSSTAAVYGEPKQVPIPETHPLQPVNPYGESKLMVEKMLRDSAAAYGLRYVVLRYFNACGADLDGELGENHNPETHLIPRALLAILGKTEKLKIFGNDYPTPDGTAVRDYVHVADLADAHVKAVNYITGGGDSTQCNLGVGKGYSIKEVLTAIEKVTGKAVPAEPAPRREGDPAVLVADATKAKLILGWEPLYSDLDTVVTTAWKWFSR